jgi:purine nucleosidase
MTPRYPLRIMAKCRVVVDNDWSGDPDGLVALAHHLLSPSNRVVAVTSSFLNPMFASPVSKAADGAVLARELVGLIDPSLVDRVFAGGEEPYGAGTSLSAAAEAIVVEARRDDLLPLFLVCGGPLTNVAAALEHAPDIAGRLTLVWIGGSIDPTAYEYNRDTDPAAVQFAFSRAGLEIWQFPLETYRQCAYSVVELEDELGRTGRLGVWLWNRFTSIPLPDVIQLGGVWPLGDSPPVLVTALTDESSSYTSTPPGPDHGGRRVYMQIDFRLIVADMLAKLRRHQRQQTG